MDDLATALVCRRMETLCLDQYRPARWRTAYRGQNVVMAGTDTAIMMISSGSPMRQ
jgi:hypothetical protein